MSKEDSYAEVIGLTEPEELPSRKISQQSVLDCAKKLKMEIERAEDRQNELENLGLRFGGRTLLMGPPGTDFFSFIHHIATEIPIRLMSFRFEEILDSNDHVPEMIRAGFEFAKRNSPALLYISDLGFLAGRDTQEAVVFSLELQNCSWDDDDVLVICQTTDPKSIDRNTLVSFDQTYVFESATLDDRVRVLEKVLEHSPVAPSLLADLTEGWAFSDMLRLASFLVRNPLDEKNEYTKSEVEKIIDDAGIVPLGRKEVIDSLSRKTRGEYHPTYERVAQDYPDEFLDQLYLMAVGDDFLQTQDVIETLNSNLPLSPKDREFLSRYPFLLTGTAEEKLTRLLRAKRSKDRLDRLLGR